MIEFICPKCKHEVKTNGVGSDSSKFNKVVKFTINTVYRLACRVFDRAARWHDFKYHIFKYGKTRADREFLRDCLKAIKNRENNWLTERWLKYQANKFYLSVKYCGQDAYDKAQMECFNWGGGK